MIGRPLGALAQSPPLLLTLTTLFWSGNTIAGQLADGEIAPFQLTFLRWVLVASALWLFFGAEVRRHWPVVRPRLGEITLMAGLGFTGFNGLYYLASLSTTGVNVGILQGSMPVFVLVMAYAAYGTPIALLQALGVALTLCGVVTVATGGSPLDIVSLGIARGDGLMLIACLLYAFYTVALRRRPEMPGRAFFALMAVIAALTSLPFAIAEQAIVAPGLPSLEGVVILLFVAVFPSCLAQLCFMRGVDLIGPGAAGVYINLVPIFSAFLAVMLLGERFAPYHALSLLLVLGGIWLAQRPATAPARGKS